MTTSDVCHSSFANRELLTWHLVTEHGFTFVHAEQYSVHASVVVEPLEYPQGTDWFCRVSK